MSQVLTRMFALFTLVSYLVVGTVAVRLFTSDEVEFTFSTQYLSALTSSSVAQVPAEPIIAPAMEFAEIKFAVPDKRVERVTREEKVSVHNPVKLEQIIPVISEKKVQLARHELPFHEPIKLKRIEFNNELLANLMAFYRDVPVEEKVLVAQAAPAVSAPVEVLNEEKTMAQDEVTTQMAKTETTEEDAEPIFYDYPAEEEVAQHDTPAKNAPSLIPETKAPAVEKIVDNTIEEVVVADLIAFDYSTAQKDIAQKKLPAVTKMTTQNSGKGKSSSASAPKSNETIPKTNAEVDPYTQKEFVAGFPHRLSIQTTGTDLQNTSSVTGFSVQFLDDYSDYSEDYGDGEAVINTMLATPSMTRAVKVLKHGYATTYTDLILDQDISKVSLPLLTQDVLNEMLSPYEGNGPKGVVLVELDDETESASLDIKPSEILHLDGNFLPTQNLDYRYVVFVGVKSGNALLSYKDYKGQYSSKIIHVHSHAVTFEANYYEKNHQEVFSLYEEGLLSKEKAPLIVGASHVKPFASTKTSNKIGDHAYKLNFGRGLLAARRYIELSHLNEPVFVGVRENKNISVPSENFMRYVLSNIEGAGLDNRCVVQVNLNSTVIGLEVAAESVEDHLMISTQALDSDGKFYDTIGEKTQKVIVVGEGQGSAKISQDGKINFKITYTDGSHQFLTSYCSPNTYLVEQL